MPEIIIRPYQEADIPQLFEAARESWASVFPHFRWCHAGYSPDDARQFVAGRPEAFRLHREYEFAIVSSAGRFLGGCGLNTINVEKRSANLGYWVRVSERGHGVAAAAVALLVQWAEEHTTLERIEVLVATDNPASLLVAERAGAVRERIAPGRLRGQDAVVLSFTLNREV